MNPPRLAIANLHSHLAGPFTLTVAPGECAAITGPSGSGKSLFLRMVADLDPNDGDVALDGMPRRGFSPPAWRRCVAYVAAEPGWWDDAVAPHFRNLGLARAACPRLGLAPALLDGAVFRLSTGERQRLALIRTLALDPPVLLLDEPTGALDQENTELVEAELKTRLRAGTSILMVTHSAEQAARLGHRHLQMKDRRF
jgi:putative ABC transport system ATP-binding protein